VIQMKRAQNNAKKDIPLFGSTFPTAAQTTGFDSSGTSANINAEINKLQKEVSDLKRKLEK
ncbi:MAG: hypothetical protein M3P08_07620, partial [Thermoproteota archaeon]|nr:hypothetical protein [Thermoproteota archaeon]